jgi:PHD/YefM family antitoxin component YafN of YafNO toxin-antitoxin module
VANGGETVIVELQGKPAIVFVSIAEYERLTGVPLPAERERVRLAEKRGGTP